MASVLWAAQLLPSLVEEQRQVTPSLLHSATDFWETGELSHTRRNGLLRGRSHHSLPHLFILFWSINKSVPKYTPYKTVERRTLGPEGKQLVRPFIIHTTEL